MKYDVDMSASPDNPTMVTRRVRYGDNDVTLAHRLWCPGCNSLHMPRSRIAETAPDHESKPGGALWEWDGNETSPTFSPSLLVYGSADEHGNCHSFIRNGHWEFLSDSNHHLAGQTVPLPPLPDYLVPKDNSDGESSDDVDQ